MDEEGGNGNNCEEEDSSDDEEANFIEESLPGSKPNPDAPFQDITSY